MRKRQLYTVRLGRLQGGEDRVKQADIYLAAQKFRCPPTWPTGQTWGRTESAGRAQHRGVPAELPAPDRLYHKGAAPSRRHHRPIQFIYKKQPA